MHDDPNEEGLIHLEQQLPSAFDHLQLSVVRGRSVGAGKNHLRDIDAGHS